nr:FAD-binding protein [Acidovorax sp. SRB_14]
MGGTKHVPDAAAEFPAGAEQRHRPPRFLVGRARWDGRHLPGRPRRTGECIQQRRASRHARQSGAGTQHGEVGCLPDREGAVIRVPAIAGITYAMSGISIDGDGRILTREGQPIPGLYAAGCASGGLEGGEKTGYVGGLVK